MLLRNDEPKGRYQLPPGSDLNRSRRTIMASQINTRTTSAALAAVILATLIGLMPIAATILASAPSAEVSQ